MKLYRPVGLQEYKLIEASDFCAFPPRLPEQPIFYPVCHRKYAREIAQRWNTQDESSSFQGYVTCFDIDDQYISQYETHIVGASYHEEYWIPAEDLDEFNRHIHGKIKIIDIFNSKGDI